MTKLMLMFKERQGMPCPTHDKPLFLGLIRKTEQCLKNNPNIGDTDRCESAIISELNDYTYHTHPHGFPKPSGLDIQTTRNMGKKLLCIGLVGSDKVICYRGKNYGEQSCIF